MRVGIYQLRNIVNNKLYIGSSKHLSIRKKEHFSALSNNQHRNSHLQNAWNKYGGESFVFQVLEECEKDQLLKREQYYLDAMLFASEDDDQFHILGYNICRFVSSCGTDPKLSDDEVHDILMSLVNDPTLSYQKIADDYGVTAALVGMIFHGKHRSYITLGATYQERLASMRQNGRLGGWLRGNAHRCAKLTEDQVMLIKTMICSGHYNRNELAQYFDLAPNTVKKIENGQSWKTVKDIDQLLYDYIRSPKAQAEIQDENLDWTCPVSLTYAMERSLILHVKLFQLEDAVRNPNLNNEEIGKLKKKIDVLNGQVRPRLINGISDLYKQAFCKGDPKIIDETSTKDYKTRN